MSNEEEIKKHLDDLGMFGTSAIFIGKDGVLKSIPYDYKIADAMLEARKK
jgi:hypothetical protein